jgi:hypothetical protein
MSNWVKYTAERPPVAEQESIAGSLCRLARITRRPVQDSAEFHDG